MKYSLQNFTGIGLIIGTFLSYLIQYVKLYNAKKNDGISHFMLVLGSLSSMTNFIGLISVETYNNQLLLLPILQIMTPWLCIFIFYIMFVYYSWKSEKINLYSEFLINKNFNKPSSKNKILLFFMTYVGIVILLWILYGYLNYKNFDNLYYYGQSMNIIASITSIIMWIPQIIKSYKLKDPGSLSVLALAIHALGCIITFIYCIFNKTNFFNRLSIFTWCNFRNNSYFFSKKYYL